jgi:hypothetical protein
MALSFKEFSFEFLFFFVIQDRETNKGESNHRRKDCPNADSRKANIHINTSYHVCSKKFSYAFPCIPSTSFLFPLVSSHIPFSYSLIGYSTKIIKAGKKNKIKDESF